MAGATSALNGFEYNCLAHSCLLHYLSRAGTQLPADISELGIETARPDDFREIRGLLLASTEDGEYPVNLTMGWSPPSTNAAAAYGRVVLQIDGNLVVENGQYRIVGNVSALPDLYDFDPRPWGERTYRGELSTRIGALFPGSSFSNVFNGQVGVNWTGQMPGR